MMSALRLLLVPAIAFIGAFLAPDIAAAAEGGAAKPNRIKIDYAAPKNPAHQVIQPRHPSEKSQLPSSWTSARELQAN